MMVSRQLGGGWGSLKRFGIPMWHSFKNKLLGMASKAADVAGDVGSEAVKGFIANVPRSGLKRAATEAISDFADKILRKTQGGSGSRVTKHKRRRKTQIDDVLGDGESY